MKVAFVHSYYSSDQPSGENAVVDAQTAALRAAGVEVRVIAKHTDDLQSGAMYKVRTALRVATANGVSPRAELEEFKPDLVHVHNLFPNWAAKWVRDWQGPLVATLHNFRPVCAAGTLFRDGAECTLCPDTTSLQAVRHACYRGSAVATLPLSLSNFRGVSADPLISRADRIVVLSERARSMYENFGLSGARMSVVPNFVPDYGFRPEAAPGNEWVYIGRLAAEKGIRNLLAHWPANENLAIYGDGPLRGEVEAVVPANVRYLGHVSHNQIPRILERSRGLVFPSEWAEGLPLVYAEALASGRPVVAKSGNSAADDISIAGTGSAFSAWDDLPRALQEVGERVSEFGRSSRMHYEEAFSKETWLQTTLALYTDVMETAN